jgi:hypothetical protein
VGVALVEEVAGLAVPIWPDRRAVERLHGARIRRVRFASVALTLALLAVAFDADRTPG